jgi:hypothetical protein
MIHKQQQSHENNFVMSRKAIVGMLRRYGGLMAQGVDQLMAAFHEREGNVTAEEMYVLLMRGMLSEMYECFADDDVRADLIRMASELQHVTTIAIEKHIKGGNAFLP